MIEVLSKYYEGLFRGALVTFEISFLVWIIGLSGAIIIITFDTYAKLDSDNNKTNNRFYSKKIKINLIGFLFSIIGKFLIPGIPVLVLLYWFYYPVQESINSSLSPFTISVVVLSIVNIVATSYIMKGIIEELPKKYITSAKLCGLSKKEIFFKISLPLIFRSTIGPVLLIQLAMLHNSIFASLINVKDILWQAKLINSQIHKPIEIFTILALFFLIISVPVIILSSYLKNKYTKNYTAKS
ncbi:MAG: hypothetical protein CMC13_14795 [Flavobacteriaceae bacterium]|nr:hypothetical protein [Flavobacteriaceae bacterium]|tara:strand:+ start:75438 stop:76160 length:723 start_codon:yes stop_codon:yes gene_type:complete